MSDIFAKEGIGLSEARATVGLGDAARKKLEDRGKLSLRKTDDELDELNYSSTRR